MSRKRDSKKKTKDPWDRRPQVAWPAYTGPQFDVEVMNQAEVRGLAICPIVTGLGRHPRTITDEDWVLAVERYVELFGRRQMLIDLLHITKISASLYFGPPEVPGNYPKRRHPGCVPLPSSTPADIYSKGITPEVLEGFMCNPVYAGIPDVLPAIVSRKLWLSAAYNVSLEIGLRQFLVNYLHQLRSAVHDVSEGRMPFGYSALEE